MPFLHLKKNLHSKKVKKVCQHFASSLQSKLEKIQRSKMMKETTGYLLKHRKKSCEKKKLECHHDRQNSVSLGMDEIFCQINGSSSSSATTTAAASSSNSSYFSWALVAGEHLEDVDARAERFIAKFREELVLEKQKSIEEYQAMLARGM